MQALSIVILIWLYAVAVMGFLNIILLQMGLDYSSAYFSIVISSIGAGLGVLFYVLSFLKHQIKIYIVSITMTVILFLVPLSYIISGLHGLAFLAVVGFFFIMSAVPIVSVYSLLKSQKPVFLASAAGIMIFYFVIILLAKAKPDTLVPFYSDSQVELLLLFFISFICFIELGVTSMYFKSVKNKMTPNENIDETMLSRFNSVSNRYLIYMSIFLVLCYTITIILLWNANYIKIDEFMGITLNSAYGVILLVTFTVIGAFLFWLLIPREKIKNNTFNDPALTNINQK